MRKLSVLASIFMIAFVLLSACSPQTATDTAPVEPEVDNPYIYSGQLDGNGAPPDFFSDVHIRKAFAYAFDWDTFARDIYNNEAVQSIALPLLGMPGYDPNQEHYYFDLAKSEEEFKLADLDHDGIPAGEETDGSDVWNLGFRLQIVYVQGNTVRQNVAEILASKLYRVNELFLVDILGLPFPAFLSAQRAGQIPIIVPGWQEDIHDPHNWYQPFLTGAYASRQHLPEELAQQLRDLVNQGVTLTDPAERSAVYAQLNQLYYENAISFPLVNATSHVFEQSWMQGRVMNPLFAGIQFDTLSKAEGAPNPTTFTLATISDPVDLDPALSYDTASGQVVQNVYETLVFFDGAETNKFVPRLAESWEISDDGMTYTFHIRPNVAFHSGSILTPSDVAYSFQRGLLQGGYVSPQPLLAEPFFGVGYDDVSLLVDDTGALADDREAMIAADPEKLQQACELVQSAIVADDEAGTVTMTLEQPWGPFLAVLAGPWGSVLEKSWVIENDGWDGSCDTWQNFYAASTENDSINHIVNGTGPFIMDHWTASQEVVLVRNPEYWGPAPALERVVILPITEFGTRLAMLQAGDADYIDVIADQRPQVDMMVGEMVLFDIETNQYLPPVQICSIDPAAYGVDKFIPCADGETGTGMLRLYIGRPGISQDVVTFNFEIR